MRHLALLALALGLACSQSPPSASQPTPTAAPAATVPSAQHAEASARPGSHEDWCGGHQVPESQCTQCNPSLTAAFKATGDWCEEHTIPESQCRKCNPDLKIERPPKQGG